MSWAVALTLAVPAIVAIAGYLFTYRNNLRLAERKDRLERVTTQLRDFYGPLLALSSASNSAWLVFRSEYRRNIKAFWDPRSPPSAEEAAAWRLWMTSVFMPLNRQMRDLVVNRADLIEEDDLPRCLLDLCAHVAAYEPVLSGWATGDYSQHTTPLNFPASEVRQYASAAFRRLKADQSHLLARDSEDREPAPTKLRAG
jgi:hypothetical protein